MGRKHEAVQAESIKIVKLKHKIYIAVVLRKKSNCLIDFHLCVCVGEWPIESIKVCLCVFSMKTSNVVDILV